MMSTKDESVILPLLYVLYILQQGLEFSEYLYSNGHRATAFIPILEGMSIGFHIKYNAGV